MSKTDTHRGRHAELVAHHLGRAATLLGSTMQASPPASPSGGSAPAAVYVNADDAHAQGDEDE